ncbi:MAG: hypothetical protein K8M05_35710, partial [Deltaproteobacteria bacterium]|nr:hypothetical protein [Kofleriaceae bacterium]
PPPRPDDGGERRARDDAVAVTRGRYDRAFADHLSAVDLGAREHYADAALYDYEYRRRRADVQWYRDLARGACSSSGAVPDA